MVVLYVYSKFLCMVIKHWKSQISNGLGGFMLIVNFEMFLISCEIPYQNGYPSIILWYQTVRTEPVSLSTLKPKILLACAKGYGCSLLAQQGRYIPESIWLRKKRNPVSLSYLLSRFVSDA